MVCPIDISNLNKDSFKCGSCNICENKESNGVGQFNSDLSDAKIFEEELKNFIVKQTGLTHIESIKHKNADLSFYKRGQLICRVEAKLLKGKAPIFMKKIIQLEGKETLVVDEPKFEHYLKTKKEDNNKNVNFEIPTFIVWRFDRPCEDFGGITIYQELDILNEIIENNPQRKFERKTNENDMKNGKKLGVTRKIHFSISETKPIWKLTEDIFLVIQKNEKELDEIIEYVQNLQKLSKIKEDINAEDIKNQLASYVQLYTSEKIVDLFEKIYISLDKENKKYFTFNELLKKEKFHDRMRKFSTP